MKSTLFAGWRARPRGRITMGVCDEFLQKPGNSGDVISVIMRLRRPAGRAGRCAVTRPSVSRRIQDVDVAGVSSRVPDIRPRPPVLGAAAQLISAPVCTGGSSSSKQLIYRATPVTFLASSPVVPFSCPSPCNSLFIRARVTRLRFAVTSTGCWRLLEEPVIGTGCGQSACMCVCLLTCEW